MRPAFKRQGYTLGKWTKRSLISTPWQYFLFYSMQTTDYLWLNFRVYKIWKAILEFHKDHISKWPMFNSHWGTQKFGPIVIQNFLQFRGFLKVVEVVAILSPHQFYLHFSNKISKIRKYRNFIDLGKYPKMLKSWSLANTGISFEAISGVCQETKIRFSSRRDRFL